MPGLFLLLALSLTSQTSQPKQQLSIQYDYTIIVSFSEACLRLYDWKFDEVASYPVALPRYKVKLPISGEVTQVILNPYWYPPKSIKDYYKKYKKIDLPDVAGPGSPFNFMGDAKVIMRFEGRGITSLSRIHGTKDEKSIGKRASFGCIRLLNDDVKKLAALIKDKKVRVLYSD